MGYDEASKIAKEQKSDILIGIIDPRASFKSNYKFTDFIKIMCDSYPKPPNMKSFSSKSLSESTVPKGILKNTNIVSTYSGESNIAISSSRDNVTNIASGPSPAWGKPNNHKKFPSSGWS